MATGQTVRIDNHDDGTTIEVKIRNDWRLGYTWEDNGVHVFNGEGVDVPIGFSPTLADVVRAIRELEGV